MYDRRCSLGPRDKSAWMIASAIACVDGRLRIRQNSLDIERRYYEIVTKLPIVDDIVVPDSFLIHFVPVKHEIYEITPPIDETAGIVLKNVHSAYNFHATSSRNWMYRGS